jgi:hypothetical protein
MSGATSIDDIVKHLQMAETEFSQYCSALTDEQFFYQPPGKWSAAQQVKHLITATNMCRLVFTLPKFIVRIVSGKPNRNSRTYDELVAKYKQKLEQGGRASGRYVPKPITAKYGKEKLLNNFTKAMQELSLAIKKNWKEPLPDKFLAPHPLLGKITLRELGYFNIYHTLHHLTSITNLTKEIKSA